MTETDGLYRVIYISRSRIPGSRPQQEGEIRNILAKSRQNNVAAGLTGALMFNANWFAQALEGKQEAIRGLFKRLHRDRRHAGITTVEMSTVPSRLFSGWSMAYAPAYPGETEHPLAYMTFDEVFRRDASSAAGTIIAMLTDTVRGHDLESA